MDEMMTPINMDVKLVVNQIASGERLQKAALALAIAWASQAGNSWGLNFVSEGLKKHCGALKHRVPSEFHSELCSWGQGKMTSALMSLHSSGWLLSEDEIHYTLCKSKVLWAHLEGQKASSAA